MRKLFELKFYKDTLVGNGFVIDTDEAVAKYIEKLKKKHGYTKVLTNWLYAASSCDEKTLPDGKIRQAAHTYKIEVGEEL